MYCWVQALHALQHLAQACPEAAEEQAQMQAGSAAADGRRLVDVPLPAPGDLPPAAAAAAVQDGAAHEVLCSSAALMESAAGVQAAPSRQQAWSKPGVQRCCISIRGLPAPPPCRLCGAVPLRVHWGAAGQVAREGGHEGEAPPPPSSARRVQLPVVQGADAQQLRLQPLGPLLAAYMAQRWQQAPGAELPRAAPGGEGSSDEGF